MLMNKILGRGCCIVLCLLPVACGSGASATGGGGSGGASGSSGTAASAGMFSGGGSPTAGLGGSSGSAGAAGMAPAPCTTHCPVDLLTGVDGPWGLAVDSGFAYVLLLSESTVMRVPLAGGAAQRVTSVQYGSAGRDGIAVDGSNVYLTVSGGGTHAGVLKAPIAGGVANYLVQDAIQPEMLRADSTNVYWSTQNSLSGVPIGGGDPIPLAHEALTTFTRIAIDSSYIYWSESPEFGGYSVKRVTLAPGGQIEILATGLTAVSDLEVDDKNVYVLVNLDLLKIPIAGGDPVKVVPKLGTSMVLDGDQVYATNDTSVLKVAKSGGTPTVLATAQTRATSITVDATSIYWLDQGSVLAADGAVRKLGK